MNTKKLIYGLLISLVIVTPTKPIPIKIVAAASFIAGATSLYAAQEISKEIEIKVKNTANKAVEVLWTVNKIILGSLAAYCTYKVIKWHRA